MYSWNSLDEKTKQEYNKKSSRKGDTEMILVNFIIFYGLPILGIWAIIDTIIEHKRKKKNKENNEWSPYKKK